MTKTEKKKFLRSLTASVLKDALAKVPALPENWDGVELRQYLADKFLEQTFPGYLQGKRKRDYKNEILVRNI